MYVCIQKKEENKYKNNMEYACVNLEKSNSNNNNMYVCIQEKEEK